MCSVEEEEPTRNSIYRDAKTMPIAKCSFIIQSQAATKPLDPYKKDVKALCDKNVSVNKRRLLSQFHLS